MEEYQHPVLRSLNETIDNLRRQIELLEQDNAILRNDRERLKADYAHDVENVRNILIDSLATDQREYVDVDILANSIADVFAISLLKTVRVSFTVDVEADVLVPAGFDISDLAITDVTMEAWNSEVDEFSVQSFDVGTIEEM
jgi:hypothetical protein